MTVIAAISFMNLLFFLVPYAMRRELQPTSTHHRLRGQQRAAVQPVSMVSITCQPASTTDLF